MADEQKTRERVVSRMRSAIRCLKDGSYIEGAIIDGLYEIGVELADEISGLKAALEKAKVSMSGKDYKIVRQRQDLAALYRLLEGKRAKVIVYPVQVLLWEANRATWEAKGEKSLGDLKATAYDMIVSLEGMLPGSQNFYDLKEQLELSREAIARIREANDGNR